MADIPQVLATYDALVGVALGAGLTYGFSALSRRHQEKREDKTRWYEARLKAYASVTQAVALGSQAVGGRGNLDDLRRFHLELAGALGAVRLIGSEEVVSAMDHLFSTVVPITRGAKVDSKDANSALMSFDKAARKDLGHPLQAA
jgi:hypothetical protein